MVFQTCSYVDGLLWFSSNIDGLFKCLSLNHDPAEWCLFIDSSKRNLKAVLLHNGYLKPSIPIASVHLHESRGGSRAAVTSKMERFVIIVNGWKPLTIITKRSILDVVAALDPLENLGTVSDEHGKRFHQVISAMEKRYQGLCNDSMLAGNFWTPYRHQLPHKHRRKSKSQCF